MSLRIASTITSRKGFIALANAKAISSCCSHGLLARSYARSIAASQVQMVNVVLHRVANFFVCH